MQFGAHLPLALLRPRQASVAELTAYAAHAENVGFQILAANDHLVFTRPYLDCLTSLAAVISCTKQITLMTTIALPVARGPVQLAKALTTMATLSGGRLIAGVGPGSYRGDYAAADVDFEERWASIRGGGSRAAPPARSNGGTLRRALLSDVISPADGVADAGLPGVMLRKPSIE